MTSYFDKYLGKKWQSNGAVGSNQVLIPGTYPRCGTVFELKTPETGGTREYPMEGKENTASWLLERDTVGPIWKRYTKPVAERIVNLWSFKITEGSLNDRMEFIFGKDPAQQPFLTSFLSSFKNLVFTEIDQLLVSPPMLVTDAAEPGTMSPGTDKPLWLTFVVEFNEAGTMIQRAYGSNGYVAVYCCPLYRQQ